MKRAAGRSCPGISSRRPPSVTFDALQHGEADIPGLVGLYAKLSRIRALSSKAVVHCAEDVARKILNTYLEPDKSFVELREMAIDGTIDLLQGFSDACHDEFEEMRPRQF